MLGSICEFSSETREAELRRMGSVVVYGRKPDEL